MGKNTGFMDYNRKQSKAIIPQLRIKNFNEFHIPLSKEEQQKQGARCMDCGVPFCQNGTMVGGMVSGCPLHNLIPEWNDLVYRGNYEQALQRLLKTNLFPEFTCRVCPALCEKACTASLHGDAVSVRENEMAIIEYGYEHGLIQPMEAMSNTNKKIVVIGSGPSGLACAHQLRLRGHEVSVYERNDRFGGLLMYGIPNMKLEKQIIERRLDVMKASGIQFVSNQNITTKAQAKKLLKQFDAVVLACGSSQPRDITCKVRDVEGVYLAVDFLTSTTKALLDNGLQKDFIDTKGKHVLVVGGGDTGNDCVGTSIRHGCKSVTQLEMMPKPPEERSESNPWPEWPLVLKTDYGQEESIALFKQDPRVYQTTIKELISENGKLSKAKLVKLAFTYNEETKRNDMSEVEGSEYIVDCDIVLIAAGFIGAQSNVCEAFNVSQDARNNVVTTQDDYATNQEKVFVCGDMRRGQSLVVWAIQEGKQVAKQVDATLMGYTNL